MTYSSRVILSMACAIASIENAHSSSSDSYQELNDIVVTGTRTPKLLKDSPVSIEVINSDQLSVLSSGTLSEVLNFIPGVTVTRSIKDGYNVQMQGFGGDRVLVLVNGQRLITPTGSSADLDQIASLDVERIEVMRGAGSVLYGSAAMGGVINVITKSIESTHTSVGYEVGSFLDNSTSEDPLEHRLSLTAVSKGEIVKSRVSYQHLDRPGFKYDKNAEQEDGTANEKHFLEGTAELSTENGRFSYQVEYLREDRFRSEGTVDIPSLGTVADAYFSNVEQVGQNLQYQSNDLQMNAAYTFHDEKSGRKVNSQRDAELGVGSFGIQKVLMKNAYELASGLEYEFETMSVQKDGITDERRDSFQGYTQFDWFPSNNIEVLAGIRIQEDSGFGLHHASRISAKVQTDMLSGSTLTHRVGLGQSYKVPTLKQLHYELNHLSVGNYVIVGNESLQPEESLTFNFGYTFESVTGFATELTGYYTEANNLIENVYSTDPDHKAIWGDSTLIYIYENIKEVEIKGGDLSFKAPLSDFHFINASYGYIDARNEAGVRLSNRPRHQVKLNYQASFNWLETDLIAYAVYQADEAYNLDGFTTEHNNEWTTLNFSIVQKPLRDLTLRYGVQNVLDTHKNTSIPESAFDSREKESRRIYLGVSYKL